MRPRRTPTVLLPLLTLVAAVLLAGVASAATTAEQRCAAAKNKTAGKYAACRENAEALLASTADASRYADAVAKCAEKFSVAWQKVEDKAAAAGASCQGAHPMIESRTDAYAHTVATLIGGQRFEDNGDGTVTDLPTGLQWEKKETSVRAVRGGW